MVRRAAKIRPGQVWVCRKKDTRTPSRRVVEVTPEATIVYSTGGELLRYCEPRAFRLWIRRYQAIATRTRRPRSLVLR